MLNKYNNIYTIAYLKQNIKVLKNNEIYRVHDMMAKNNNKKGIAKEILDNDIYKGTILEEYVRTTKTKSNYTLLCDIIKQRTVNIKSYDNNYVFIHIRTGDDIKSRGLGNQKNIDQYLSQIKQYPQDKIMVIVTALHYGHSAHSKIYNGSKWLYNEASHNTNINLLHDFIKLIPNKVEIISNSDVDTDMLYLGHAKNLITLTTSGGFSKVVKKINDILQEPSNNQ